MSFGTEKARALVDATAGLMDCPKAYNALMAALAQHEPDPVSGHCKECGRGAPCPTVRAVELELT